MLVEDCILLPRANKPCLALTPWPPAHFQLPMQALFVEDCILKKAPVCCFSYAVAGGHIHLISSTLADATCTRAQDSWGFGMLIVPARSAGKLNYTQQDERCAKKGACKGVVGGPCIGGPAGKGRTRSRGLQGGSAALPPPHTGWTDIFLAYLGTAGRGRAEAKTPSLLVFGVNGWLAGWHGSAMAAAGSWAGRQSGTRGNTQASSQALTSKHAWLWLPSLCLRAGACWFTRREWSPAWLAVRHITPKALAAGHGMPLPVHRLHFRSHTIRRLLWLNHRCPQVPPYGCVPASAWPST